ncbi:MAG: malate dehydrogenase, partial [Desulfonatronovibrionaceae bacterium]
KAANPDCIMGTGRSDYPNQDNNVSGFPFIFRGALDISARTINEEMKIAAACALADLAKEPVPQDMLEAYGLEELSFGPDYVIPKPLDSRIIEWESTAVAEAAMTSGVARSSLDLVEYRQSLKIRMEKSRQRIRNHIAAYQLNI